MLLVRALFAALAVLCGLADSAGSGHGSTPVLVEHFPAEPGADASAAVIFLHGLGDTGSGWQRTTRRLAKQLPHIKFILPTAPQRPVTVNGGRVGHAWYDIAQLPGRRTSSQAVRHDIEGIMASADEVERLIAVEAEALGIPRSRVVVRALGRTGVFACRMVGFEDGRCMMFVNVPEFCKKVGGFSQGATVSLFTGLRNTAAQDEELLAGIISLSGCDRCAGFGFLTKLQVRRGTT